VTSLWCDLGYGRFDGAHLVAGFEDLNPANTYWSKYYHLFSNIDTEEKRFLDFEKWWGGYFKMTAEEIRFIINELFIGNELEQGHLRLDERKVVNLKNFKEPILVFASGGDNITPPPQALNWIYKVYGTVEEIKRCGQVIIYMVHKDIGHLGIFVSGRLAQKEHRQILGHIGWLEYLTPGLYEMVIEEGRTASGRNDYQVRFESREMADLLKLDDGLEDEDAFVPVNSVSRFNDFIYRSFFSPWVKLAATPPVDSWIRTFHPLRMQHYTVSDRNPLCWPVKWAAERVATQRRPVSEDNAFLSWEHCFSEATKIGLDYYRDMRDLSQEYLFKAIYANPWIRSLFGGQTLPRLKRNTRRSNREKKQAHALGRKGGYVEACIRVMIAISGADRIMNDREFETAEKIVQKDRRLRVVPPNDVKAMIKAQSRVLDLDPGEAIGDLAALVPAAKDRRQLLEIARKLARADGRPDEYEEGMLEAIAEALAL